MIFFKFIKKNGFDIIISFVVLAMVIAWVAPFVIAISRALWYWALL